MRTKKFLSATALAFLLTAGAAAAQTTTGTTTGTTTPTSTPTPVPAPTATMTPAGVPNTGAGGDAAGTAIVLGTAALLALAGGAYLLRRPAR